MSSALKAVSAGNISGTEFPHDNDGHTYHVGIKAGKAEVANLILQMGDPERAALIVKHCLSEVTFQLHTTRGFITYTGTFEGKRVTVMAIGMGTPMQDFAVREPQDVADPGPMAIIRLGSCGTPRMDVAIRTVVVAKESFMIRTNYDAFHYPEDGLEHYTFSKSIKPDTLLHAQLVENLKEASTTIVPAIPVLEATDATAEFFYSTQGRKDPGFKDHDDGILQRLRTEHPDTASLQMETFHLFHLGAIAKARKIHVAACAIVLANRQADKFLGNEEKHLIEIAAGRACLKTLVEASL